LRRLGPFDPEIFLYSEDMDLGLRARAAGLEIWFWPAARVIHHRSHATTRAFGGEPFARLARQRHDVVARRLGERAAARDDLLQALTFANRVALKRLLRRPADREREQLAAIRTVRRDGRL
jgi:GT2 family glycosyltransferase